MDGGFRAAEILAGTWALSVSHGSPVENCADWVLGSHLEAGFFASDADRTNKTIIIVKGEWDSDAEQLESEIVQ